MKSTTQYQHTNLRDILSIIGFLIAVFVGAALINHFIFRSFSVAGPSMEPTLYTGDRLIVNRLPVTWSNLKAEPFNPERGQVIVFKNPNHIPGSADEFIVKRIIAYPNERVVLKGGELRVYNTEYPDGFLFDSSYPGASQPTDGSVDIVVPEGEVFVAGDHRQEGFSLDSRNGLGTIPYSDLVGPVSLRIFPFSSFRTF